MDRLQLNLEKIKSINCESCELFRSCKNPFIRPIYDWRAETKETNTILVVADWTDGKDDYHARYFNSGARGYKIIEGILNSLECRYIFTTALACGITNKDLKVGKKNYQACFQEKLKPLILKEKPRVIICLGKQAMDAVLQDRAPKTMKEISKTGMSVEWKEDEHEVLNSLVLAVDHPVKFLMEKTDKDRLAGVYEIIFKKAERYCLETEVRKPVEFELVTTKPRLYALANLPFKEMAFDVENRHHNKDLTRNTIWKRNSNCLSLAITYYDEKLKMYKNFVVVGEPLHDKFLIEKLFSGRSVVAHNGSHDIQVIYKHLGVDVFEHASEVHDTLAMFYLSNQNRLHNGLKDLSAKYLGIYDYADTVQRFVIEANQRLKKLKAQKKLLLTEKLHDLKWYKEALRVKETQEKVASSKRKKINLVLSKYSSETELLDIILLLKNEYKEVPEPGTADYGDIPISVLAQYNAEDTYCTLKLKREIIPYLERIDSTEEGPGTNFDPLAYKLFQRALKTVCYVERNGLPLDMNSLLEMKEELEAKELEVKQKLLQLPAVQEAIAKIPTIQEKEDKGTLTEEDKLAEVSPTKNKFITNLCKDFGLQEFALLTKGNNYSFTSKKCINNIRDSFKDKDETIYEIFRDLSYIGNNRQIRAKFIGNWRKYWVPETGCFHSKFNLTKNQSLAYASNSSDSGAQSGRLSSQLPNLQQIRKVGYLRKHFKAPPGYVFCEIDYSSLEPCLIAFVANCERLKEVFRRKLDIYRVTANDIYDFGVDMTLPDLEVKELLKNQVDEIARDKLKVGFLAWCYGRGISTFCKDMKITEEEAHAFYAKARQMYSEIYDWKEGIREQVKNQELIYTLFGRKRSFPVTPPLNKSYEERHRHRKDMAKAVRVAVNFPIQGLGSDICLWQASNIQDWILTEMLQNDIIIVNLVHDALWFLIKESEISWAIPELQRRMEDTTTLPSGMDVPLRTEADYGPTLASYLKKNKEMFLPYP